VGGAPARVRGNRRRRTADQRRLQQRAAELDELRLIGEDDDSSPSGYRGAFVRFRAKQDTNYCIAVDSYYSDVAPEDSKVELTVSDGSIAGKGVSMAVEDGQTVDSLRSAGLKLIASARREIDVRVELLVTKRVARRLGLKRTILGKLSGDLDYGQALDGTLPLTSAARPHRGGPARLVVTTEVRLAEKLGEDAALIKVADDVPDSAPDEGWALSDGATASLRAGVLIVKRPRAGKAGISGLALLRLGELAADFAAERGWTA
jgi:hypothetical protein